MGFKDIKSEEKQEKCRKFMAKSRRLGYMGLK